jgi:hypothetical protein
MNAIITLQWLRLVIRTALLLLSVTPGFTKAALAQTIPSENSAESKCNGVEQQKGFELRLGSQKIISKFIARPDENADHLQIQRHMSYLQILGKIAATQVYNSSSRECLLAPEFDYASLHLMFTLVGRSENKCLLSFCASRLSKFLESAPADPGGFFAAVNEISNGLRRLESVDLSYPMLSTNRAAGEAYRHIYPPGSMERIYFDLASQDYHDIEVDGYTNWFLDQQRNLRNVIAGNVSSEGSLGEGSLPERQTEDEGCATSQDAVFQEIKIDHHGWGQRSLIMINHARRPGSTVAIKNAALQAFCDPHRTSIDGLDSFPWTMMDGRIQCFGQVVNQDRWLILYSVQDPPSGEDMSRYARAIATTLRADKCVPPNLQIFVVTFLRQK